MAIRTIKAIGKSQNNTVPPLGLRTLAIRTETLAGASWIPVLKLRTETLARPGAVFCSAVWNRYSHGFGAILGNPGKEAPAARITTLLVRSVRHTRERVLWHVGSIAIWQGPVARITTLLVRSVRHIFH